MEKCQLLRVGNKLKVLSSTIRSEWKVVDQTASVSHEPRERWHSLGEGALAFFGVKHLGRGLRRRSVEHFHTKKLNPLTAAIRPSGY